VASFADGVRRGEISEQDQARVVRPVRQAAAAFPTRPVASDRSAVDADLATRVDLLRARAR
jgi:hypothetical protein